MAIQVKGNSDGSIQSQAQQLLVELRSEFRKLEEKSDSLEKDYNRLHDFMSTVRWMITTLGSAFLLIIGFISWAGMGSVRELRQDVLSSIDIGVSQEILKSQENVDVIALRFAAVESQYEEYLGYVESIKSLSARSTIDPVELAKSSSGFAYNQLERLESKGIELTVEDARLAKDYFDGLIYSGLRGDANPHLLFNGAIVASRMDFDSISLKLATLAAQNQPSIAHLASLYEKQDLLGKEYSVIDSVLIVEELTAEDVRRRAWSRLLDLVATVPREEAEQVYSKASNVAVRNRSAGYYSHLIDAIEKSHELRASYLTSYAYITLADMYVYRGGQDWEKKYSKALTLAFEKLRSESPLSSWYEHSILSAIRTAVQVDKMEEVVDLGSRKGIDLLSPIE